MPSAATTRSRPSPRAYYWAIDVASAFHKRPPFESEALLGLILDRSDNAQAPAAEKYDEYVLASCGPMPRISRVLLPVPSVNLKWLRFDDSRQYFPVANVDASHMLLQGVALPRGPRGSQFTMAASDQVWKVRNFIPFYDVPVCPSLTLIKRSR